MKLQQVESGDTLEVKTIDGKKTVEAKVTIVEYNDDGQEFLYCPSLEMITNAKTKKAAMKSFKFIFNETMDYCLEKNTLQAYLFKNGWASILNNQKYENSGFLGLIKFKPEISETLAFAKDYTVHTDFLLSA